MRLISDPAQGINVFFGVPSIYQFMAQHASFATSDFSRLVIGGVGGAPMPVPLLKVWEARGVALQQGYGMTETSPVGDGARQGRRGAEGRLVRQAGAAYRSADRAARRHRRRCRRTRRALGQGPEHHAGLLEPARRQQIILHRRLAAHRRRHAGRRGRLLLHRRPLEGHVHFRRRERLSGRSRERAAPDRRRLRKPRSLAFPTNNGARSAWPSSRSSRAIR